MCYIILKKSPAIKLSLFVLLLLLAVLYSLPITAFADDPLGSTSQSAPPSGNPYGTSSSGNAGGAPSSGNAGGTSSSGNSGGTSSVQSGNTGGQGSSSEDATSGSGVAQTDADGENQDELQNRVNEIAESLSRLEASLESGNRDLSSQNDKINKNAEDQRKITDEIGKKVEALSKSAVSTNKWIIASFITLVIILIINTLSFAKLHLMKNNSDDIVKTQTGNWKEHLEIAKKILLAAENTSSILSEMRQGIKKPPSPQPNDAHQSASANRPLTETRWTTAMSVADKNETDRLTKKINDVLWKSNDKQEKLYDMMFSSGEALSRIHVVKNSTGGTSDDVPADFIVVSSTPETDLVGFIEGANMFVYPNSIQVTKDYYHSLGYNIAFGDFPHDCGSGIKIMRVEKPAILQRNTDGKSYCLADKGRLATAQM